MIDHLIQDNRQPRMPRRESLWSRLRYLVELSLAALLVVGFWWGLVVIFLSFEKVM